MSPETYILIVEDDPDAAQLIEIVLRRAGFRTLTAFNGWGALRNVQQEKPALIVLDVMMPSIDGYEVCRRLRNDPDTETIPVLMLTAKTGSRAQKDGFESGADDYVFKPVKAEYLVSRVRALLWADGWSHQAHRPEPPIS
jgi:DNA-binding response OmpR family regulator